MRKTGKWFWVVLCMFSLTMAMPCHAGPRPKPKVKTKLKAKASKKYDIFKETPWVDSVMNTMTLDDKIGQLFMVAAFTDKNKINTAQLDSLVQYYHIGGVIFFKGNPCMQADVTNSVQELSRIPVLVGMDAEWGLAMRLDSTINFGYQMPLGAISGDSIVYKMGHDIAMECKRLGINIDFAPVVDVNNNPLNPIINLRSFGENKKDVARKSLMYMRALQDEHILAVAKHFPGHGNVDVDSHLDLPVLNQSKEEMDTVELYPFKYLFARGVGGVMIAHLHIPAYDTTKNIAASLSPLISTQLLRNDLNFKGLAISDALNMKGVTKYYAPGQLEVKALLAGNDILLYSENVPKAIEAIKNAIDSGCIDTSFINDKVRRILEVKQWVGLDTCHYINLDNITSELNTSSDLILKQHIAEQSITVVRNNNGFIPLKNPGSFRIASLAIGTRIEPHFQKMMRNYCKASYFHASFWSKDSEWQKLRDTLKTFDLVVISLHNVSNRHTDTYGIGDKAIAFINEINAAKPVILVNMGTPYALKFFPGFSSIIEGYQDADAFQYAAAEALFGAIGTRANLPVTACTEYCADKDRTTKGIARFRYTMPEEAGMASETLDDIDSIVKKAIKAKDMPGCEILVARNDKVVYDKSFGNQLYDSIDPVKNDDLYDLASITKVAATTMAVMKLYEQGKISLNATLATYLPELKNTNKGDLSIKEVMTHQAGLESWIPFYKKTLLPGAKPDTLWYCKQPNELYSIRVADSLYLNKDYEDSIYNIIIRSPIKNRGKYEYSDLGFILMQHVVERITGTTLDKYVDSVYYKPLGLATMTFKPRDKFPLSQIVPTERDTYFRHQLVHGDVHDPAAAMLGGVSGNAGLFSNANDLAILLQMMLNGGEYAGVRYLKPQTIKLFTSKQYADNRRGLGWDRPVTGSLVSPASQYASDESFGHTGFTGTCIWADPKYDLIYVFLSNRVYPSAANNDLLKQNVRTDIHDAIYRSFLYKYCKISN